MAMQLSFFLSLFSSIGVIALYVWLFRTQDSQPQASTVAIPVKVREDS